MVSQNVPGGFNRNEGDENSNHQAAFQSQHNEGQQTNHWNILPAGCGNDLESDCVTGSQLSAELHNIFTFRIQSGERNGNTFIAKGGNCYPSSSLSLHGTHYLRPGQWTLSNVYNIPATFPCDIQCIKKATWWWHCSY